MSPHRYNRRNLRSYEAGGSVFCATREGWCFASPVMNASSSGAALGSAPQLGIGSQLSMRMRWTEVGDARVHGRVVRRCEYPGSAIAVRFEDADESLKDLIADLLLIEQLRYQEPRTLLCGEGEWLDRAEKDLEAAGLESLRAATELDAIQRLLDPWNAIVALALPPTLSWLEFSSVAQEEFPSLRRVLLAPESSRPELRLVVKSGLVDACVFGPWHREDLLRSLRLFESEREFPTAGNFFPTH